MDCQKDYFEMIRLCEEQGLLWLQGPGGNASFKSDGSLYIKPSGRRMSDLKNEQDLSQVDLPHFRRDFGSAPEHAEGHEVSYKELIEKASLRTSLRPSMETGFHALLPGRFVLHIHSLPGILLADELVQNRNAFDQWYESSWKSRLGSWALLPALMPGFELARAVQNDSSSSLLFLQNHGVILHFDSLAFLRDYLEFETSLRRDYLRLDEIAWASETLKTGPFPFYFPDMKILESRVRKILSPAENGFFRRHDDSESVDRDAHENWIASQWLYRQKPSLKQLPPDIIGHVNELPTEIVRKKEMGPR